MLIATATSNRTAFGLLKEVISRKLRLLLTEPTLTSHGRQLSSVCSLILNLALPAPTSAPVQTSALASLGIPPLLIPTLLSVQSQSGAASSGASSAAPKQPVLPISGAQIDKVLTDAMSTAPTTPASFSASSASSIAADSESSDAAGSVLSFDERLRLLMTTFFEGLPYLKSAAVADELILPILQLFKRMITQTKPEPLPATTTSTSSSGSASASGSSSSGPGSNRLSGLASPMIKKLKSPYIASSSALKIGKSPRPQSSPPTPATPSAATTTSYPLPSLSLAPTQVSAGLSLLFAAVEAHTTNAGAALYRQWVNGQLSFVEWCKQVFGTGSGSSITLSDARPSNASERHFLVQLLLCDHSAVRKVARELLLEIAHGPIPVLIPFVSHPFLFSCSLALSCVQCALFCI